MGRTPLALTVAAVTISTDVGFSQSRELPSFEVASVRMTSDNARVSRTLTDTRVDITASLNWVLFWAFRAQYYEFQISAPAWLSDAGVEIHATMPAGATVEQVPEMLQRLLAERFGLVVHREVRQTDGYELLVGPDGIKMREVAPLDELQKEFPPQFSSAGRRLSDTTTQTPDGTVRRIAIPGGGFIQVTSRTLWERSNVLEPGARGTHPKINATRMTMAELVPFLWETVDAPVVDKTGLTGVYQFTLELPRGTITERLARELTQRLGATASSSTPSGALSAVKAIESLGLKIERRRVPVEVVVVDKMSRTPTEN